MFTRILVIAAILSAAGASHAAGNYEGRKGFIINICPYVELTSFSFSNQDRDRRTRFVQNFDWTSKAQQPIVAFEIVTLKYDAFDQRTIGTRMVVTGTNSANWAPLAPGASASDGTLGFGEEEVLTSIAYVRRLRLADGTVWAANEIRLRDELKKVVPGIREFGSLLPDPKTREREQ